MPTGNCIKLSSPATREFWEIPILFEDDHLLAINKPASLLVSPDRYDPERPNLMRLLHQDLARKAGWAECRGLTYLANAHRLDFETTGVLLLAKNKPALVELANQFGSCIPKKTYLALARGESAEDEFEVDLKLSPDPTRPGRMRWGKDGKKSLTRFKVLERFRGCMLLEAYPETGRTHQIRVHLLATAHPIYGDTVYSRERLWLSQIKRDFRQKPGIEERALTPTLALHARKIVLPHPVNGALVTIEAPWPKDFTVSVKYLRRYAPVTS